MMAFGSIFKVRPYGCDALITTTPYTSIMPLCHAKDYTGRSKGF